jgi:hypothetical protein
MLISATEACGVVLFLGKTIPTFQFGTTESVSGSSPALMRAQRHMSPSLERVDARSHGAGLLLCGRGKVRG